MFRVRSRVNPTGRLAVFLLQHRGSYPCVSVDSFLATAYFFCVPPTLLTEPWCADEALWFNPTPRPSSRRVQLRLRRFGSLTPTLDVSEKLASSGSTVSTVDLLSSALTSQISPVNFSFKVKASMKNLFSISFEPSLIILFSRSMVVMSPAASSRTRWTTATPHTFQSSFGKHPDNDYRPGALHQPPHSLLFDIPLNAHVPATTWPSLVSINSSLLYPPPSHAFSARLH